MAAYHSFQINEDSTFIYKENAGLIKSYSAGVWHFLNQNEIILKSDKSLQTGVIDYVEEFNPLSDSLSIRIVEENGLPLSLAVVTFNGDLSNRMIIEECGVGIPNITNIEFLDIYYLGWKYSYKLSKPNSNMLTFKVRLKDFSKTYFDNDTLKLNKKKLIWNNLVLKRN